MSEYLSRSQSPRAPAAEVWRGSLARIPTVFGRLAYLSELRRTDGRYEHPALAGTLGPDEADRTLRHSHHQVFGQWLNLSLEEQKHDLDAFLREADAVWKVAHYRDLTPPGAREVERQLYFTDLETLLELLKFEHGAVSPSQEA